MKHRITLLALTVLTIALSVGILAGTPSQSSDPCCKCEECDPKHLWLCFCNGDDTMCEDHVHEDFTEEFSSY